MGSTFKRLNHRKLPWTARCWSRRLPRSRLYSAPGDQAFKRRFCVISARAGGAFGRRSANSVLTLLCAAVLSRLGSRRALKGSALEIP